MKIREILFLWLVITTFGAAKLKAAVFTVVSNADTGPGTLRDALEKAAANGSTERDYIHFALPGSTVAALTITVATELPGLSSNLTIDGSTQPTAALSPNGAKVIIIRKPPPSLIEYFCLQAVNVQDIEIYGLVLKRNSRTGFGYGIFISASSQITIGKPGKGNVIIDASDGIGTKFTSELRNITIQSNIIGLDVDGVTLSGAEVFVAIELNNVTDLLIGGNTAAEGNVLHGTFKTIASKVAGGTVQLSYNKIGTDISGTTSYPFSQGPKVFIDGVNDNRPEDVLITDNQIAGDSRDAIAVHRAKTFKFLRNKIGTDVTGTIPLGHRLAGIEVNQCGPGIIGGSAADENIIAGCEGGVIANNSRQVTISRNRMFCNAEGILLGWHPVPVWDHPFIKTLRCEGNTMSGITRPNAKIEVFAPYRCTDNIQCDGRDYIETFYADAAGNWSYPLNGRDGVIFTSTDETGATSKYSTPDFTLAHGYVTNSSCGRSNGKIRVLEINNAGPFYWEDNAGNVVSREMSLVNVPAGKYRLVMYSGGCSKPECIRYSPYIEVRDEMPRIRTTGAIITNASCGQKNGSIRDIGYTYFSTPVYSWRNAAGAEVSDQPMLSNAAPGEYSITLTDHGGECVVTAGPFKIENVNGPTLDVSGAVLGDATCGKASGSISGLQLTGTAPVSYTWKNESGATVGTDISVHNLLPGTYTLYYKDGTTCPTAQSDAFTIQSPGLITIGQSSAVFTPSGCNIATGGVTGITFSGAETFSWTNTAGSIVGTGPTLREVAAGTYTITAANVTGCSGTATFNVPQVTPATATVSLDVLHPSCDLSNGSITTQTITGNQPVSFKWIDKEGVIRSTLKDLQGVGEGTYEQYITDADNCEQKTSSVTLKNMAAPAINTATAAILHDACNLGTGSIKGISISGHEPYRYEWMLSGAVMATSLPAGNLHAGEYSLRVTDRNGCVSTSAPLMVNNTNIALAPPTVQGAQIVKGMTAYLSAIHPLADMFYLEQAAGTIPYSSSTGKFSIPELAATTTFMASVQKGDCVSEKTPVTVEVVDAIKIVAPNAFSPNGDGVNDLFRLKAFGLAFLDFFTVYNRWGSPVFTTQNATGAWDGTHLNVKVPAGTYVWSIRGKDITGAVIQQQGTVVVVY